MNIKQEYESLVKKHKLPSYEDLDKEFELLYFYKLEEVKFPLRFVRRRIFDKIKTYIRLLESIINPNPGSLISLEESKFFSQEEKKEIIVLLKEMVSLDSKNILVELKQSEKEDAFLIKEAFEDWKELKEKLHKIGKKINEGWISEVESKKEEADSQYFG